MQQPTLFPVDHGTDAYGAPVSPRQIGEMQAEACADHAESRGWDREAAESFILGLLSAGPVAGETLVTEASKHYPARDARAYGAILGGLARRGVIVKDGYTQRQKGHGTSGGIIWRLA